MVEMHVNVPSDRGQGYAAWNENVYTYLFPDRKKIQAVLKFPSTALTAINAFRTSASRADSILMM